MTNLSLFGKEVGNLQIAEELGCGGMVVAREAWQASLNCNVALKVLSVYLQNSHAAPTTCTGVLRMPR